MTALYGNSVSTFHGDNWNQKLLALKYFQQLLCRDPLISGTRSAGVPACRKNGCCNNSAAVALCAGSRTNMRSKNPCNLGDT